jgi:hypothetical protein
MNNFLIRLCCAFIIKKKNRKHFREKYRNETIEKKIYNFLHNINLFPNVARNGNPIVKINVVYHKISPLFKNEVLVPIHVGRAIKKENDINQKWLHDNMIGDDTGKNISKCNENFAEFTAIYWAHHNYNQLGNPEYYGCFHYRRLYGYDFLWKLQKYDVITTTYNPFIIKEQFEISHGKNLYSNGMEIIKTIHPDKYNDIKNYFENKNNAYFCNFFVMKRNLFFEYCEFIEPILLHIISQIKETILKQDLEEKTLIKDGICYINEEYQRRHFAFFLERCTSYFLWKIIQRNGIKVKNESIILLL